MQLDLARIFCRSTAVDQINIRKLAKLPVSNIFFQHSILFGLTYHFPFLLFDKFFNFSNFHAFFVPPLPVRSLFSFPQFLPWLFYCFSLVAFICQLFLAFLRFYSGSVLRFLSAQRAFLNFSEFYFNSF